MWNIPTAACRLMWNILIASSILVGRNTPITASRLTRNSYVQNTLTNAAVSCRITSPHIQIWHGKCSLQSNHSLRPGGEYPHQRLHLPVVEYFSHSLQPRVEYPLHSLQLGVEYPHHSPQPFVKYFRHSQQPGVEYFNYSLRPGVRHTVWPVVFGRETSFPSQTLQRWYISKAPQGMETNFIYVF
jgi:hypothetical protein